MFKVGDKVRRIHTSQYGFIKGEIYKVERYDPNGLFLYVEGIEQNTNDFYFELVKEDEMTNICKPHKHIVEIIAWANGAQIQFVANPGDIWTDCANNMPTWNDDVKYRVKPEPKPDVEFIESYRLGDNGTGAFAVRDQRKGTKIKFVADGETGQIKDVSIIKD